MVESQARPGKIISFENFTLASMLLRGQAETFVAYGDSFNIYNLAAVMSGFEIKVIAKEGEEFPYLKGKISLRNYPGQSSASEVKLGTVSREGWVAISIEKPEGEKDFDLFHKTLGDILRQESIRSASKPK